MMPSIASELLEAKYVGCQQPGSFERLWIGDDLSRRSQERNTPMRHHQHAVGLAEKLLGRMAHHDYARAGTCRAYRRANRASAACIKTGTGLVEQ
jgi:hypothetical protein